MYSYIAPTVTDVTGLPSSAVPWFLLAFGIGGTIGTVVAGRMADWSIMRSLVAGSVGMGAWLGGVVPAAGWGLTAPSWVGVGLSLAGLAALRVSAVQQRRSAFGGA